MLLFKYTLFSSTHSTSDADSKPRIAKLVPSASKSKTNLLKKLPAVVQAVSSLEKPLAKKTDLQKQYLNERKFSPA